MYGFTDNKVGDIAYKIFVVGYFGPEECFLTYDELMKCLDGLFDKGIDPHVVVHLFDTDHNFVTTMEFDDYRDKYITEVSDDL